MSTHMLDAARARYAELRRRAEAIKAEAEADGRDVSEAELSEIRSLVDDARPLADDIKAYENDVARADKVAAMAAQVAGDGGGEWQSVGFAPKPDPYRDAGVVYGELPPKLVPDRDAMLELYRAARDRRNARVTVAEPTDTHTRAAVTLAGDAGRPTEALPAMLREPRRLSTAARLQTERVTGLPDTVFPVFGDGAADIVAENVAKPEYANIAPGSATPQMISVWTDVTRQTLATLPTFDARLRQKLAALIANREDQLLVSTVLGTTGIQTYIGPAGAAAVDSLLIAAGMVLSSDVAAEPDVAVVNPGDLAKVMGASVTGTAGETPPLQMRLQIHGMTIYPSPAVVAGEALVGAWQASSRFVDGLGGVVYLVDATSQMKNNIVTVLGEEAVNVAVEEPSGFVAVTYEGT